MGCYYDRSYVFKIRKHYKPKNAVKHKQTNKQTKRVVGSKRLS